MTKATSKIIAIIGVLILILMYTTLFIVNEGQQAILLRLGAIVNQANTNTAKVFYPGLHFKIPMIYQVKLFDTRLQTLDIQSSRIVTLEKKDVIVDSYVKWRISNLALYFKRTGGNTSQAALLLEQQLNDALRAEFGKRTISEVISDDRVDIMQRLNKQTNQTAQNLGIDVIDVRIKRIDLPTEVSAAVFERMRAERERIATEHRAQGKAKAEAIRANADASVTIILATAQADAAQARGQGDALAAQIYADSYSKDANFYLFYRSMLAYQQTFTHKNDIIVTQPDSLFFKYFNNN